jgi:hypothetical protein
MHSALKPSQKMKRHQSNLAFKKSMREEEKIVIKVANGAMAVGATLLAVAAGKFTLDNFFK